MRRIMGLAVAVVLALSMAAWAGEIQGKIQKVDAGDRSIVLEDGTQVWLAEGLPMDKLQEGKTVKASFEERDGKKIVTSLEVAE
jgi:hypothetical protein